MFSQKEVRSSPTPTNSITTVDKSSVALARYLVNWSNSYKADKQLIPPAAHSLAKAVIHIYGSLHPNKAPTKTRATRSQAASTLFDPDILGYPRSRSVSKRPSDNLSSGHDKRIRFETPVGDQRPRHANPIIREQSPSAKRHRNITNQFGGQGSIREK
ncbi:hypothetical protein ACEQ8H_006263 [Pleosporales sp. CAS-2024a]